MRVRSGLLPAAVAAFLVLEAPLGAFTLVESNQKVPVARGDSFRAHLSLNQAALCDGSVKLKPGEYDVEIVSMGDGSVRSSFFDRSGRKAGQARGIIAVLKQGPASAAPPSGAPAGGNAASMKIQPNAAQKVAPAAPTEQLSLNFTKLGFGANSRASVSPQGQKLNLEIVSNDGSHGILIGLLLPAVQKVREAAIKQ
jgi:hypothetical protein